MTRSEDILLSADSALTNPDDDRLGYSSFAEHIAKIICNMKPEEGFVIAVYGPWGSGKTTLLNFITHYLNHANEVEPPIMVVHFNPWWFSGQEDLTLRFFYQLQAVLGKGKFSVNALSTQIADLADILSDIPIPYAATGKSVSKLLRARQKDIFELKNNISKSLKEHDKRILVIIDDIDRLTPDEIRQTFRVIKAIANFPNIIYLVTFDKEIVVNALSEPNGFDGEEYIEKIVQLPLELPPPDETSFQSMLLEKLNKLLGNISGQEFDQTYWADVYLKGLERFISTPRDITRLINALSATYPLVKGEVNPIDFIAAESMRVFYPKIYYLIQNNPKMFIGNIDKFGITDPNLEDHKAFHESMLNKIDEMDRDIIKNLLTLLFPKLRNVYGINHFEVYNSQECRKQFRICSPEMFPIYFRLAIPKGGISNAEICAIINQSGSAEAFGSKLVDLTTQKCHNGKSMARVFFDRIRDYTDKIPPERIGNITNALFDRGDELLLPEDERPLDYELPSYVLIAYRLRDLIFRLDRKSREDVLRQAILKGHAITIISEFLRVQDREHGRFAKKEAIQIEDRLICEECLIELEKITLKKIINMANNKDLLNKPYFQIILFCWQDWGNKRDLDEWITQIFKNDIDLVTFIGNFVSLSHSNLGVKRYLDFSSLQPFISPMNIIDRIKIIAKKRDLNEKQRFVVNEFIEGYDSWLEFKDIDQSVE